MNGVIRAAFTNFESLLAEFYGGHLLLLILKRSVKGMWTTNENQVQEAEMRGRKTG